MKNRNVLKIILRIVAVMLIVSATADIVDFFAKKSSVENAKASSNPVAIRYREINQNNVSSFNGIGGLSILEDTVNNPEDDAEGLVKVSELDVTPFSMITEMIQNQKIKVVYYTDEKSDFVFCEDRLGNYYKFRNPSYETFKKDVLSYGVDVVPLESMETAEKFEQSVAEENERNTNATVFAFVILFVVAASTIYFTRNKDEAQSFRGMQLASGSNNDSSSEKVVQKSSVKKFSDVAGLYEVKKDVMSLVDFLKNRDKYERAGAKLPKGVVFYGPPGTGKTLLAKAIAGEADVPFLYASGSDFVEMYVGVGAKRIRELFSKAKKMAPCIVFIDEIDAVGGTRSLHTNSEDRKTINALLTEMDGFKDSSNILVIGATNRIEDMDQALLRPGRFTDKYCVPLPETTKERMEVINLYRKNKSFSEDVSFEQIAKETSGFSPAQIESLLNEAAIISVQKERAYINKSDIESAMYKLLLSGHIREDQTERDEEERKLVAWHEAGHAVVGKIFGKDITKVTILSGTSGAGGVTFSIPSSKKGIHSVGDLKHEVMELYGGRCAEMILYDGDSEMITTGASNDIERATGIIHSIVTKYGMNEYFGLLNLKKLEVDEDKIIESEVVLAQQLRDATLKLLNENCDVLKEIADRLLEEETIYGETIDKIFGKENSVQNSKEDKSEQAYAC